MFVNHFRSGNFQLNGWGGFDFFPIQPVPIIRHSVTKDICL